MCPRCGQSKEDQFHVFVKCPWNVQRIGKLKSEVRECMKAMIWSELVARTEIENMEWFGCEKEKKEGTGIDVRRWNAEVEMGYKGILPREAVKEHKNQRNGGAPLKTLRNALLNFAGKCGRKEMSSG